MASFRKLLIVEVAALGWDLVQRKPPPASLGAFHRAETVFPALTCVAQASFRTASPPAEHGMIANGLFFRDLAKVMFWEQAAALVQGGRIWSSFRARGRRVGMTFWQQSLGETVDLTLSPAPIHKHSGGMIQDCYGFPGDLEARLIRAIGRPFNLMRYWGPLASRKSSDWIVEATRFVMRTPDLAPDVLFSYLPHLDYDLQRHGPKSKAALIALETAYNCLDALRVEAEANGYEVLFFGDYAIEPVSRGAVFLNRCLREAGLFFPRYVKGRAYADFWRSRAFAMADHQVAHVFASDQASIRQARAALEKLSGVGEILDRDAQQRLGVAHARGGELLLAAAEGYWFAYPWWDDANEAPDFASHVDIHNKPGYDPCELFFGWPPWKVCQDPARVRGSHGRSGTGSAVAWLSSFHKAPRPASLLDLARSVQKRLESG